MAKARIGCLDLDTFFVSVERLLDPTLRGRAVVVGGHKGGRGVVTSASYEARAFGVRSGMSIRDATALAPHAAFVPGHHASHTRYSERARAIVERFSPIVIAASIDEQYVDFHGCESLYRRPEDADDDATILRVVRSIVRALEEELGLPASAGIASSKSMAKVACALAKPHGVLFVREGDEAKTLAPLPVRKLPSIGPVAEEKLRVAGLLTLGDLARASDAVLRPIFGASTTAVRRNAVGQGAADLGRERPAFREHDRQGMSVGSISNERTFVEQTPGDALGVLSGLCERVCARARARGVRAGCVTLRLRYVDFHTITRARALSPTSVDGDVLHAVLLLYRRARPTSEPRRMAIRLLGVALSKLVLEPPQLELPTLDGGARRARTVDAVRAKFGYDALHLATTTERARRA